MDANRFWWLAFRLVMIVLAYVFGVVGYLYLAIVDGVVDGLPGMIFQPVMAALVSGLLVAVGVLLGGGLALIPPVRRYWRCAAMVLAPLAILSGATVFALPLVCRLSVEVTSPEIEGRRQMTGPGVIVLCCYLGTIFILTCFPNFFRRTRDGVS